MNIIYGCQCSEKTIEIDEHHQQQKGNSSPSVGNLSKGPINNGKKIAFYHYFWWDGLCDSRTASILAREEHDADEIGDEKEIENEETNKEEGTGQNITTHSTTLSAKIDEKSKTDEYGNIREQSRSPNMVVPDS
jgi:hypothetical protein